MRILAEWTDDHLPCFAFEHEGLFYELMWTGAALIGRFELVAEGEVSIAVACKHVPELLAVLESPNPVRAKGVEPQHDGSLYFLLDAGGLTINVDRRIGNERRKKNLKRKAKRTRGEHDRRRNEDN